MTDQMRRWDDAALADALRGLGEAIAWPEPVAGGAAGAPDLAARVRARIVAEDVHPVVSRTGIGLALPRWRVGRRALVFALAALLILAALAGAAALGLPGLRITLGEPSGPPPNDPPSGAGAGGAKPTDSTGGA